MGKKKNESLLPSSYLVEKASQLSEYRISPSNFDHLEEFIRSFREPSFANLTLRKRFKQINQTLCQFILDAPPQTFLLKAVLNFFDRINKESVLKETLDLTVFEFWLNHFSEFSEKENNEIRAKIIGKNIPREEYQIYFPIGMGKTHFGTHFVTAHLSPDVDTMMASFWGWMDAFGARVGSGLHLWCLPGGPPDSPVTSFFSNLFGSTVFPYLARTSSTLTLTAMDLVTQKLLTKELGSVLISSMEHSHNGKAIIHVNEQGHYLGDLHSSDVELVRQITILFKSCLHWFENNLHTNLISLFAKTDLSIKDLSQFNSFIFDVKIKECEPVQDFNKKQQNDLDDFFKKVLHIKNGLECTFRDLNKAFHHLKINGMFNFQNEISSLQSSNIFDQNGCLKEDRPQIFNYLKKLIKNLDDAIFEVRNHIERLDVVLKIKYSVLNLPHNYLTLRSDVNEIQQKMQGHEFLTVVIYEQDGSLFPVGIVRADDLREQKLGTVSLRDFCNLEEVRMASYLEVISVIDHHKSSLKTPSVPTAVIGDAQSCNVLIAEQTFKLNDKYSLGGMTPEKIEEEINKVSSDLANSTQMRILQRLLQRRLAYNQHQPHFIHAAREFAEYICFLQAIIDDTDLLTKVSQRDVECVAQLLNRLKSLSLGYEVEIIDFDDIPKDTHFAKAAAKRILQQADMYSLYKQIYSLRESEVESNLDRCIHGQSSNVFLDTKEQNGCARVGQTKIFTSNFPFFLKHASKVRQIWLAQSQTVFHEKTEIDLHIHMISTIASAEEVYANQIGPYKHQDELWLWVPDTQAGYIHLNSFLAGFQKIAKDIKTDMSIEFSDVPSIELKNIFELHFHDIPKKQPAAQTNMSVIILRFKAGALNSRKSMITPFLPRL